jgi:hypothetical protein
VANIVLALQGGAANGSEPTFDGQPMQKGVHLRWSFLAALGFPPGGFWLCRRAAKEGEKRIPPPPSATQLQAVAAGTVSAPNSPITSSTSAPTVGASDTGIPVTAIAGASGNTWQAVLPAPCQSVTLAGCAAPGCDEIIVETFSRDTNGNLQVSGRRAVLVEEGSFRIRVQARSISCVRVVGAGSVDECGCGTVEPPQNCGDTGGGWQGGGYGPPGGGKPGWGPTNDTGWQCWGVPFTLPVTVAQWPARYFGAPDPATTAAPVVEQKDIQEARRRLGTLQLAAGLTSAQENQELGNLRDELARLVGGFPATLLNEVFLLPSAAGANAPNLNINLMQELLLLALDPYFARVLGLYFVDDQTAPGVKYDYCITGYWGATPCQTTVAFPGLAPAAPLARGSATFGGITIQALGGSTSLWRWTKFDINGNYLPRIDPASPTLARTASAASIASLNQAQLPDALLLATSPGSFFQSSTPQPQVSIALSQPVPRVDIQVAGRGTVQGLSNGTVVSSAGFSASQLQTVTVNAPNTNQLIDQIQLIGVTTASPSGYVVVIGALTLHPLSPDAIGTRYALIPPPVAIQPIAAPGQPHSTFRHRQADIDTATLTLVPHSLIDVEWPAQPVPASQQTGDPVTDPLQLPPPTLPIGFVAQRQDVGVAGSATRIPGWIATRKAPKPKGSSVATANLYRLVDSQLADPVVGGGGWSHRVAAFDLFGALGAWSNWSAPRQVEKIAAAPTAMRLVQFDNTQATGGGAPAPDGSMWTGGTLRMIVNWAGAAFMMYPDIVTARITVEAIDSSGNVTGQLTTNDLTIPAPTIQALTVSSIIATLSSDGISYVVEIQTTPALVALASTDPAQILMLTLPDGSTERYTVRPAVPASSSSTTSPVVASLTAGNSARIVTSTNDFLGQPAYLLSGYGIQTQLTVPLDVPIAQQSARAQVSVTASTRNPFLANEMIVDPNGVNLPRPEPQSVKLIFNGPQRLVPPAPPTPALPPTPAHQVNHLYYNPADANGNAGKTLPFTTPSGTGISGYVLQRAPVRSLALADVKRRIALANIADNNPVVVDSGQPRADLAAWIASLTQWLSAYNAANGTSLTVANALADSGAQRAFIEHFYGGLLDDELCVLADVPGQTPSVPANSIGYARVNPQPIAPASAISDTIDGTGYGRTLYRLAAVNQAGSMSSTTNSIGPYYTRIVTPPRPPVLYKLQPTETAIIVAWALDTNPDVAAYVVYRAASVGDLEDMRYFGADWAHPAAASALPSVQFSGQSYPPLSFVQGTALNIDKRLIGFVPDPRLCARDYGGSNMAEIALPPGPPPDQINGVYRLSDYASALGPLGQIAFNYWTPPAAGGIAELVTASPTQSRLTGLRIGLGRGVPVVVVATWNGSVKVIGQVPVRRAGFVDGVSAGGVPLDPNAISNTPAPSTNALNAYVVVAVDIFGNRSAPSSAFATQMLVPVVA